MVAVEAVAVAAAARRLKAIRALTALDIARHAGLTLDPWQADLARSTGNRLLLNCARQTGKSLMASLLAVTTALTQDGSLTLLLSPTLRQSGELFRKALGLYVDLGRPVPPTSETALSLSLANGSRIVSLPGKEGTVRGYSGVGLLVIDEASRVSGDLYASVRPMMATSSGRLIALSTPFGARGWWYESWRSNDPEWERYQVTASDCPRISQAFLDEERRVLGAWWYAQEYECQFMDSQTQAFSTAEVDRAFEEDVEIWDL